MCGVETPDITRTQILPDHVMLELYLNAIVGDRFAVKMKLNGPIRKSSGGSFPFGISREILYDSGLHIPLHRVDSGSFFRTSFGLLGMTRISLEQSQYGTWANG